MASTQSGFRSSFTSAADLSADANLGLAVALDTDGLAVLATDATGDDCIGPLYEGGRFSGDHVCVTVKGPAVVRAGAAFDEADILRSNAASRWVQIDGVDDNFTALAFQASLADGNFVSALIIHGRAHAATP